MRSRFHIALLMTGSLLLVPACFLGSGADSDDDDDDDDEAFEDTASDPGVGSGSDGFSPLITEGYAGYSNNGGLGITAIFNVKVTDPNDDVEGGVFELSLNSGEPFAYEIGGEDVTWNDGSVSLIFSNVDPEYYTVQMQVFDRAGNPSNVWDGEISY